MVKVALKVLNVVVLSFLSLILFFNLYNIFAIIVLKQNPPQIFGFSNAIIISGSMAPDININDMVIIKSQKEYEVGDVVTFREGNVIITHELVEIDDGEYITKGVANNTQDGSIDKGSIVGKVIFVIPNVGKFVGFLKSPLGMLFLILIAGMILFFPSKIESSRKE